MPIILAMWEAEMGGQWSEACPRLPEKQLKAKRVRV
jgi:hypothetical protein